MGKRAQRIFAAGGLLLVAAGALFLWQSGFFAAASPEKLRDYIQRWTPYSHLAFFFLQLLSVVLAPIPSNVTAAAGGMLFGTWTAFLLTYAAVLSGSLLVFQLARTLGRDFTDRVVSRRLSERYQDVIRSRTSIFLTLAFLFPYFPDDILCIMAGLTRISGRKFALIVALSRPWGLLFASALGGSAVQIPIWGLALLGAGGIAAFFAGMKYGAQWEQRILICLRKRNQGRL